MAASFSELLDFVRLTGPMYGVEDFSIFLYSVVKMHQPAYMVELGSGSGSCSLLAALAMCENGTGRIESFDNGSHWPQIRTRLEMAPYLAGSATSYHDFMNGLAERFSVSSCVQYLFASFPSFPAPDASVDLLFSDYESHPAAIASLLSHYLPKMSPSSSIFIDGASTYLPSFLFLERLITDLNNSKIPAALLEKESRDLNSWIGLAHTRRYTLVHLTEQKKRHQNSTTWLKIEPVDHVPHPITAMR